MKERTEKALFILTIALIFLIGLFAINQFLNFYFKAQFLKSPCTVCQELNPEVSGCFKVINLSNCLGKIGCFKEIKINLTTIQPEKLEGIVIP